MNPIRRFFWGSFGLVMLLLTSGCGIALYPGHPGFVTNGYSKIDLEFLTPEGLYVYETTYDNRQSGAGVGAIVTKFYPGAQTFTSNARTNTDGTVYRHKAQYEGAEVHMISLPQQGQIVLPPNSTVVILAEFDSSMDEVDDQNTAEQNLFKPPTGSLSAMGFGLKNLKLNWLRAGQLLSSGDLAYDISAVELGNEKFTPGKPVHVESNFFQNGVRTNLSKTVVLEFARFFEEKFPKGYKGPVKFYLKGSGIPVTLFLGLHTVKTVEASGKKVIRDASAALLQEIQRQFEGLTQEQRRAL